MSSKVCEHSLRWILNLRHLKAQNLSKELIERHPMISEAGHSGGSFIWTEQQSVLIDKIGIDQWLKTDNVLGYDHHYGKFFRKIMEN